MAAIVSKGIKIEECPLFLTDDYIKTKTINGGNDLSPDAFRRYIIGLLDSPDTTIYLVKKRGA